MITITDMAKEKLLPVFAENPGKLLRIVLNGIGWGGPKLGVALDEPREDEQPFKVDGIDVLIGDDVKPYASGNVLDWVQAYGGEGFVLQPESGSCCWFENKLNHRNKFEGHVLVYKACPSFSVNEHRETVLAVYIQYRFR